MKSPIETPPLLPLLKARINRLRYQIKHTRDITHQEHLQKKLHDYEVIVYLMATPDKLVQIGDVIGPVLRFKLDFIPITFYVVEMIGAKWEGGKLVRCNADTPYAGIYWAVCGRVPRTSNVMMDGEPSKEYGHDRLFRDHYGPHTVL